MIEDKKKLAGAIVGSDESWLTELDNDTFKQLIALNKDAILQGQTERADTQFYPYKIAHLKLNF